MVFKNTDEYIKAQEAHIKEQTEFYKNNPDAMRVPELSTGSGRGGARPGAGRKKGKPVKPKSELKKSRSIRMTDDEYPQVVEYLKQLRKSKEVSDETI